MNSSTDRRLRKLEQSAKIDHDAFVKEHQWDIFEELQLSADDEKLMDAIVEREGIVATPEEQAALDRFSAEYERAARRCAERKGFDPERFWRQFSLRPRC
jgi:hypothetical protein